MTANDYQQIVISTAVNTDRPLLLGGLGLSGECGEVNEIIKKHEFHGKDYNRDDLALELGDVCWYIAYIASILGFSFEQILQINAEKIKTRYPNGFKLSKWSNPN